MRTPERRRIRVSTAQGGELRIHLLHFPGWEAWLDEVPLETRVEPRSGLLLLQVPAGEYKIELRFGDTVFRFLGKILALGACLLLLLLLLVPRRRSGTMA